MWSDRLFVWIVAIVACPGWNDEARAQRVQAVPGRPFGVAQVTLPLSAGAEEKSLARSGGFTLHEPNGRVFYPVFDMGRFAETASEFLGTDLPFSNRLRVSFLFTGDEPFEVTLFTPQPQRVRIFPERRRDRQHAASLRRWWRGYNAQARAQMEQGDYPPLVENYLTEMLSLRLGLEKPRRIRVQEEQDSELTAALQLLFGIEELRDATLREMMRGGGGPGEPAETPLPAAVDWTPHLFPDDPPTAGVEPLALRVPQECFYVRFGSFRNYMWLDRLQRDYGGDLGQMLTLRGHNARLDEKFQYQLALRRSAAAEFLGPQIISDVAMLGRDLYLREGAAMGILFEARNGPALSAGLHRDRGDALEAEKENGAALETVVIAGREVSFLSTPDNRIRSFYAVDGDYHLVTTSRTIVERFFEAAGGRGSLGASREFQHFRQRFPLEREHTVAAYFSAPFFEGLISPQYQIELTRRLRSVTGMELVRLARLAALGEGRPQETIDDLVTGGFLPETFRRVVNVDELVTADNGHVDPRRGLRGTFTPIPDVPLDAVTATEAALYARRARFFQTHWPQMDPLMICVKRFALDEEQRTERLVIDANVSPLEEEKYGWILSLVGPPTDVAIRSNPAHVVSMQMSLQGGRLWPDIPPHHLFLGVQDGAAGGEPLPTGFPQAWTFLRRTPGFVGAWPQLGLLERIPFLPRQPDAAGFTRLPLGLWRWQGNRFSTLSFHREVLASAVPHLEPVPTENPAQIRLNVRDLSKSRLADWVNEMNYDRARRTSEGNVRLLNTLVHQLRVPPEESLKLAHSLLDTELVCTLGGEYALRGDGAPAGWVSTAWAEASELPADYKAPLLGWFRGVSAELTRQGPQALFHAEVDMQRKEHDSAVKLPLFNLFGGD